MKKLLALSLVVLLALTACPHNNKIDPNAPLALTVENLAGKWVEDGNPSSYYLFKIDKTYELGSEKGSYEFIDGKKIKLMFKDPWGNDSNLIKDIELYQDYLILQTIKYIKSK